MPNGDELIGTTEAALLVRRDARTIQRWAQNGTLTPVGKLSGPTGAYLFRRAEVEALTDREDAA